jgi:hypothetical protein
MWVLVMGHQWLLPSSQCPMRDLTEGRIAIFMQYTALRARQLSLKIQNAQSALPCNLQQDKQPLKKYITNILMGEPSAIF